MKKQTVGATASDLITTFVGSWWCAGLHAVWFVLWFTLKLDINLLTLIVSLEAIFLCIFLLMSGNRQGEKDRAKAELDLQIDTKAEMLIESIFHHLDKQDHLIIRILKHLEIEMTEIATTEEPQPVSEKRQFAEIPEWATRPAGE